VALCASACSVACSSESEEGGSSGATGGAATIAPATGGAESGGAPNPGVGGGNAAPAGGRTVSSGGSAAGAAGEGAAGTTGCTASTPEPPPPTNVPVIDSLFAAIGDDGAVAIVFEGRSGPSPAQLVRLEFLDSAGEPLGEASGWGEWLLRPNRFFQRGGSGQVVVDGNRFSGFLSALDQTLAERPERVRVTVLDRDLNLGEPVEAELVASAPEARADGEVCDALGVLHECQGAALCDVRNGEGSVAPTCQVPAETCPLDLPELEDVIEGSNEESPDATDSSCTFSRGQLGVEQGHAFTAPRAGSYRFTAVNVDYQVAVTLFVRRICDFGRAGDSELACAHLSDAGEDEPLVVELDLEAGQTVFVYVEATWVGGGRYNLSVEELD